MQAGGDVFSCLVKSLRGAGLPSDFVPRYLRPWLENGECLVLFDGLDEVVANRQRVIDYLQDLASGVLRECAVLLTTRIVGYANDMAGWEHYELLSFQEKEITQFVRWYFAGADDKAQQLLRALKQSGEMHILATNPLLLSLVCFVFEAERFTLPARRVELYDRATLHMLKRREPAYPESDKRTLLEAVALHFFERGKEIFDEAELLDIVRRVIEQLKYANAAKDTPEGCVGLRPDRLRAHHRRSADRLA